ncbi:integrase catalytic domain-containing protein [Trichonephila clavipes]|nr:integrase catalytic domain-containing protein [Trichonephila clavipes]
MEYRLSEYSPTERKVDDREGQCNVWYNGINLIELIPDILDRFRIYPVGIVADIEKAFLMLSVAPKGRDYLRFFSPCNEKQLVYRHCRVVFGVSSSPHLLNASIMHLLENCNSECKEVALKLKSSFYVDNCVTGVFSADEIDIY